MRRHVLCALHVLQHWSKAPNHCTLEFTKEYPRPGDCLPRPTNMNNHGAMRGHEEKNQTRTRTPQVHKESSSVDFCNKTIPFPLLCRFSNSRPNIQSRGRMTWIPMNPSSIPIKRKISAKDDGWRRGRGNHFYSIEEDSAFVPAWSLSLGWMCKRWWHKTIHSGYYMRGYACRRGIDLWCPPSRVDGQ